MRENFIRIVLVIAAVALTAGVLRHFQPVPPAPPPRPTPVPTPVPTPTPEPTPIYIPQKRMEVARLFNGMEVQTIVESEPGETATTERETPESYALELQLKVKMPKPNTGLDELARLNPHLPRLLPGLETMLPLGRVSPKWEELYGYKLRRLHYDLPRMLDQLLSRHNFFDCETLLELRHPETKRVVLLMQADMDICDDGSDPDRLPVPGSSNPHFQPMTSYRWPKRTQLTSAFLPKWEARLKKLQGDLSSAKKGTEPYKALQESIATVKGEIGQLKRYSFLIAETDPYVVLPGLIHAGKRTEFTPRLGDYCAVIHGNTIYPAIVGDVGPKAKVGEASLRIGKEVNSLSSPFHRAESKLLVTYVFFPGTAEDKPGPPDLDQWYAKMAALLGEIGGFEEGALHPWETTSSPAPTPTPPPTPTPTPSPTPETPAPTPAPEPVS